MVKSDEALFNNKITRVLNRMKNFLLDPVYTGPKKMFQGTIQSFPVCNPFTRGNRANSLT